MIFWGFMLKQRIFLAFFLTFFLSGCGTYYTSDVKVKNDTSSETKTHQSPSKATSKTPLEKISVTQMDTEKPHISLGDIHVTVRKATIFDADPTHEDVDQALREEAYALGADAVILARYGTVGLSAFSWGAIEGNGRAIAYQ
jgi:hypothetical protein